MWREPVWAAHRRRRITSCRPPSLLRLRRGNTTQGREVRGAVTHGGVTTARRRGGPRGRASARLNNLHTSAYVGTSESPGPDDSPSAPNRQHASSSARLLVNLYGCCVMKNHEEEEEGEEKEFLLWLWRLRPVHLSPSSRGRCNGEHLRSLCGCLDRSPVKADQDFPAAS